MIETHLNTENLAYEIEQLNGHEPFFVITPGKHAQIMYNPADTKGDIAIICDDSERGFHQRWAVPDNLGQRLSQTIDKAKGSSVYVSMNSFSGKKRRVENINQLRTLYVDIDCYTVGKTPQEVLFFLEKDSFRWKIPEPNYILHSGRGLCLIWRILPESAQKLLLWQRVERGLCERLKELGADPKATDAARVFRVAGSKNPKSGKQVFLEEKSSYKYLLHDIYDEYFSDEEQAEQKNNIPREKKTGRKRKPKSEKQPREANKHVSKISHLFNDYTLVWTRIEDINHLVSLRNGQMEGHREVTLFLYRYWQMLYLRDADKALDKTLELNSEFENSLPESEVVSATQSAQEMAEGEIKEQEHQVTDRMFGYHYRNITIIEMLGITEKEQRQLKTIIGPKEKYRRRVEARREQGIRPRDIYEQERKTKKNMRIAEIESLMMQEPSLSNRKIAHRLDISESYVRELKKEIQNTKKCKSLTTNNSEGGDVDCLSELEVGIYLSNMTIGAVDATD